MPPITSSEQKEIKILKSEMNLVNARLANIERTIGIQYKAEAVAEKTAAKTSSKSSALEAKIGMTWLARVGIVCLVLGVGFFLKYMYDRNWIGPLGRVIIGILIGCGLIVSGEAFDRKDKYQKLARLLTGGGFAALYFSVYAMYHFRLYREALGIGEKMDIFLLSIVVILAIIFSMKYDSQAILGASFFLGYLTAFLSVEFGVTTLIYCLILTLAVVVVNTFNRWGFVGVGSVFATYIVFLVWYINNKFYYHNEPGLTAFVFLLIYFIAFSFTSFCFRDDKKTGSGIFGILITAASSIFFYCYFRYWLYDHSYTEYDGLFTLVFGAVYLILAYGAAKLSMKKLLVTNLTLCITYLTLTVPIQLNNQWVTIIWALEGLALMHIAFRVRSMPMRLIGYIVGAIVTYKTLLMDSFSLPGLDIHHLLESTRPVSFAASILTFCAIAYLLDKSRKELSKSETDIHVSKIYYCAALIMLLVSIALEMNRYWITVGWGVVAISILYSGFRYKSSDKRIAGIAVFGLTIGKIFFFDLANLSTLYRFISFMGLGIILLGAAFLYAKYGEEIFKK